MSDVLETNLSVRNLLHRMEMGLRNQAAVLDGARRQCLLDADALREQSRKLAILLDGQTEKEGGPTE